MQIIPLAAIPSQVVRIILADQNCEINVYQKSTGVFLDLTVNGTQIRSAAACLNQVKLVRHKYLGFIGDLIFIDSLGSTDPVHTGLGDRYQLAYLEQTDL
jgi:hypothetical protein